MMITLAKAAMFAASTSGVSGTAHVVSASKARRDSSSGSARVDCAAYGAFVATAATGAASTALAAMTKCSSRAISATTVAKQCRVSV